MGGKEYGVTVQNENGKTWNISEAIVDNECISATQYFEEKKVSQSKMIELLLHAGHKVFTAYYHKKPDKATALKKLEELYPNRGIKGVGIAKREDYNKSVAAVLDEVFDGDAREITAKIHSFDELRGRLTVYDLNIEDKKRNIRQIDPRTLQWLILDGVKYTL